MWRRWRVFATSLCTVTMLAAGAGHVGAANDAAPKRVGMLTVPARIAFTNHQHLWIVDEEDKHAKPVQVTDKGFVEIIGWSPDGKWLLYVKHAGHDNYSTPGYLWVVKADGTKATQVDQHPIIGNPQWSPVSRQVAYVVKQGSRNNEKPFFLISQIDEGGKARLQSITAADFVDFAWMPDGKQILVSTAARKNRPMTIGLHDLQGKLITSYPVAPAPKVEERIYPWAPVKLKVSPDGHTVAYYVPFNSGSLSADGVPIYLFDLSQPSKKPIELGSGLSNSEWLSWSNDSKQLAFIAGNDRMATQNKHLSIADRAGKVTSASQPDKVDSLPVWTAAVPSTLYFTRGKGTPYSYHAQKVMVPGQRIWSRTADGQEQQVTTGTEKTADTYPAPSADGKRLIFLRLDSAEHGSVYVLQDGKETELLQNVTGDIGYYANYLPAWVHVFWKS